MIDIYLQFIPLLLLFLTGIILKKTKIADLKTADLFLKILYYIGLPAITIHAMHGHYLDSSNLQLTYIMAPVNLVCGLSAYLYAKYKNLSSDKTGVIIAGAMIINTGFMIPVVKGFLGDQGLYYLFMLDVSNGLLVFTIVYLIACHYGNGNIKLAEQLKKFFFSPPLISLVMILTINALQLHLPNFFLDYCKVCGDLTIPLLLFSLGIYFRVDLDLVKQVLPGTLFRSGIGLLTGFILTQLFDFHSTARVVLLLCSAAPVGYNTLTFAVLENLDRQFAANMVSLSIFAAFLYLPMLYFFVA